MIQKLLSKWSLALGFVLSMSSSKACDGSSISIAGQVTNPDGSVTYTLNCLVELGTLDAVFYGFVIKFNSPYNTPTVVIGGTYPTTSSLTNSNLTTGSISGSLVAKTGAAINSVVNDSDWNFYDNQTNVISYESAELFGATSISFTFQIQVTVSGCAETILFDASVNSGAPQCEYTINTGNNCSPCSIATPSLSAVTQPSCSSSNGTFTITNYSSSYTYAVTPSTGVTITGSSITAPQGSYTVTASNGSCTSTASLAAVVNAAPSVPSAPQLSAVTQPNCSTATGSFTITNYNASLTYTCSPSTGVTFSTNTVTAPAGTYTITASNGTCSATSTAVVVNPAPAVPPTPTLSSVTQPTCTSSTGSFTISNYSSSYTYAVSPSTGVTISGNSITAPQGTYTVTASNGTCTSSASLAAVVNAAPSVPSVPLLGSVTQPTCTVTTGSFTITNYNGSLSYTASPSTGVSFSTNTVTAPAGTYTITASNGTCSATSTQITINAFTGALSPPIIDAITQPSCTVATGSIDLSGLPSGSWTLTVNPGGSTISGSGTTYTVSGLTSSTYSFTVQDASGCVSTASSNATVNAQPATPTAPVVGTITQPDCASPTGSVALSGLPSSGSWTLTSNPGSLTQNGSGTSATFTGLLPATTYTFTVTNAAGCQSQPSGNVVINALPAGPAAPTASVTVQPTCTLPTGVIVVTAPSGSSYTFSIDGSNYQSSTTFSSLSPGTYNVTVQDVNTSCVSTPTVLVLNPLPTPPAAPVASISAQPTCLNPFGAFQITSPSGSNYQFSVNGNTIPIGTYSLSNLTPDQTYAITVTDQTTGCTSSAFDVTIDPVPSAGPVNAGADVIIQQGDSVVLTASGTGTMVWDNGDTLTTIVNPSTSTTYTVTLTDVNGCTSSDQVAVVIIEACGEVFIPTAFSPNGDALNSAFRIRVKQECVVEMNLKVFDRWGEVVFEGTKADDSWDGTFKGKPLDSAVFVYTLDILLSNSSESQHFNGNLTLIR